MQTFTLFFGFAIVAIAMENLTSKLHFVKTRDADAKGLPEFNPTIQSRADGILYTLYGRTGTEKVTIRDENGKILEKKDIPKKPALRLYATSPSITIEYTNDVCCPNKTDRNVYFTTNVEKTISTNHNTPNYLENWNCSTTCLEKTGSRTFRKQKDLLSRMDKVNKCVAVRTMDDCFKCKVLQEGQFCWPGNYTINFGIKDQCKDVTFGECNIDSVDMYETIHEDDVNECSNLCSRRQECNFYRYHYETQNCTLLYQQNRASACNIRAGPTDKQTTQCLFQDMDQKCDALLEEECEYNGGVLYDIPKGSIINDELCHVECKKTHGCNYWVFKRNEKKCILMKTGTKKCAYISGPREPTYEWCKYENIMKK